MKIRTTRKQIAQMNAPMLSIGYCHAQHLLRFHEPFAYTAGVYGWNMDVYDINGTVICTGYRGMCGKAVPYEIVHKYEVAAQKLEYEGFTRQYEDVKADVEALLQQFLSEAL